MSAGDAWMRDRWAKRGRIEPEKISREATVGERASDAIRAAAGRAVRRVAPPNQGEDQ